MRILLWYWGRRGGGAQFTLGLARALQRRPDAAPRLSVSAQGELTPDLRRLGLPLQAVRTWRGVSGFLAGFPRLPGIARALVEEARQADVVVSCMHHAWTPFVAPALGRAGIPYVPVVHDATQHPGEVAFLWGWRLGQDLGAARAAVALSGAVETELARRAPGLPVLRMPLPPAFAAPGPVATSGPEAGPRLLFFGRVRRYKGLDLLRDAFAALRLRHPEARLRVVGDGDVEGCAPGLSALPGVTVERRWVAEGEIPGLLAAADLLVLPYREASQSGVAPLATAFGLPVVATPVGGLVEQLRPGAGAVLAAGPTAPALAEALELALAPGALARLRAEAGEASLTLPGWDAAAEALMAGLRRVLP